MTSRFAPEALDLSDGELIADFLEFALRPVVAAPLLLWMQSADGEVVPTLCEMSDPPSPMTAQAAYDAATALCDVAAHFGDRAGLLLVWQRPGTQAPVDGDVLWVPAAQRACREADVTLHGVWLKAGRSLPIRLDA